MKKFIIALLVFILLAGGAIGGITYMSYKHYAESDRFLKGTTVNGKDVTDKTLRDVIVQVQAGYDASTAVDMPIFLTEDTTPLISTSLREMGYTYGSETFEDELKEAFELQHSDFWHIRDALKDGTNITCKGTLLYEEGHTAECITADKFEIPRETTVDPSITFDEERNRYEVVPGHKGNELDIEKLQSFMENEVSGFVKSADPASLPPYLSYEVPSDAYCSPEPKDNVKELEEECVRKNTDIALDPYRTTSVTYTFGSQEETLDFEVIKNWLEVDEDYHVTVNEDSVREYVRSLGERFDTRYHDRSFHTSDGRDIVIPGDWNEYGYTVLEDDEYTRLYEQIRDHETAVQEPIYEETNVFGNPYYYAREGEDDLAGTYVEVNLTMQHLWFYKNGSLVIESDFVSGTPDERHETQTGVFPLPYKESPSVLKGEAADGGYEVKVQYWMPFYEGQGLHDASWRGSFGGTIYQRDGSHGCVNLPTDVAGVIYDNIDAGTAIIIYK